MQHVGGAAGCRKAGVDAAGNCGAQGCRCRGPFRVSAPPPPPASRAPCVPQATATSNTSATFAPSRITLARAVREPRRLLHARKRAAARSAPATCPANHPSSCGQRAAQAHTRASPTATQLVACPETSRPRDLAPRLCSRQARHSQSGQHQRGSLGGHHPRYPAGQPAAHSAGGWAVCCAGGGSAPTAR